jgi:hypothetical protein
MKRKRRLETAALLLVVTFGLGYFVSRARAGGIPAAQALTYSGVLTDASGTPLVGSKSILVQLYDQATGGTAQCTIGPTVVTLAAGAFKVALPDTCAAAVHATPDLWVDVFVDGASVGRSKLGAVPYAVEADHASTATQASRLVLKRGAQSLSVGPYCGSTAATTGSVSATGGLTGYAAARALCATACTSPTAHMCSGVEMTWSMQLGIARPSSGWVASGAMSQLTTNSYIGDCRGWLYATAPEYGSIFSGSPNPYYANFEQCDRSLPILCCD